jgi:hypothetical protein
VHQSINCSNLLEEVLAMQQDVDGTGKGNNVLYEDISRSVAAGGGVISTARRGRHTSTICAAAQPSDHGLLQSFLIKMQRQLLQILMPLSANNIIKRFGLATHRIKASS